MGIETAVIGLGVASMGMSVMGGMAQADAANAAASNNAAYAAYRAEVNSSQLDYQQSIRDYESAFTRFQLEADRERRLMEQRVATWRANYEYDAQEAAFEQTVGALSETLTFRFNEYRRQQEKLVRDTQRTMAEVDEGAANQMTARVIMYQQEVGRARAVSGVSGAGTSTMARKMRELAFFKGVDMTTLENNRRRTVEALKDNTVDRIEAINAAATTERMAAQQVVNKMGLSLGMAAARRDMALQIIDAGAKMDETLYQGTLKQMDTMEEAQRLHTEWAKKAGVDGAIFEAQSARLQGHLAATSARFGSYSSALQIGMGTLTSYNSIK